MSGELKINGEYIILTNNEVVKIKVLDITTTSVKVHNLEDDSIKRHLFKDYEFEIMESLSAQSDEEVLKQVDLPEGLLKEEKEVIEPVKERTEVWRPIPGVRKGYTISNRGDVKNPWGKLLCANATAIGTLFVNMEALDGRRHQYRIDTLLNQIFGLAREV